MAAIGIPGVDDAGNQAKRRRTSMWDKREAQAGEEDAAEEDGSNKQLRDKWADVFTKMREGDMDDRAGEYAEAVTALRLQADGLHRQLNTVHAAREQLYHTAYREALQARLVALTHRASAGVPQDIVDAAKQAAEIGATAGGTGPLLAKEVLLRVMPTPVIS